MLESLYWLTTYLTISMLAGIIPLAYVVCAIPGLFFSSRYSEVFEFEPFEPVDYPTEEGVCV